MNARQAEASLENQGWGCSLYTIEVGAMDHIFKPVKDRIKSVDAKLMAQFFVVLICGCKGMLSICNLF